MSRPHIYSHLILESVFAPLAFSLLKMDIEHEREGFEYFIDDMHLILKDIHGPSVSCMGEELLLSLNEESRDWGLDPIQFRSAFKQLIEHQNQELLKWVHNHDIRSQMKVGDPVVYDYQGSAHKGVIVKDIPHRAEYVVQFPKLGHTSDTPGNHVAGFILPYEKFHTVANCPEQFRLVRPLGLEAETACWQMGRCR